MDWEKIILAAISAVTTIILAYIAARWHATNLQNNHKKDKE